MPLTTKKLAKIHSNLVRTHIGRTQPLTMPCKNPDGSVTTRTLNGILRPNLDADPTLFPQGHLAPLNSADAICELLMSDIDLPTLRSVMYVAPDPAAPGASLLASRYYISYIGVKGLAPGGDRWILALDRQR